MSRITRVRSWGRDRRHTIAEVDLRTGGRAETVRRTFVLSFDFEDWHQLVYQRIGRPDWREGSGEFERHIAALLDLLDELGVRATFFVAGVTAERRLRPKDGSRGRSTRRVSRCGSGEVRAPSPTRSRCCTRCSRTPSPGITSTRTRRLA